MHIAEGEFAFPFGPAQRGIENPAIEKSDPWEHHPPWYRPDRGIPDPLAQRANEVSLGSTPPPS